MNFKSPQIIRRPLTNMAYFSRQFQLVWKFKKGLTNAKSLKNQYFLGSFSNLNLWLDRFVSFFWTVGT